MLGLRAQRRTLEAALPVDPAQHHHATGAYPVRITDEEVKARLRQAVTAGIIWGWYRHLPLKGREWVVNPMAGPCVSYDADGIRAYCEMLDAAAG